MAKNEATIGPKLELGKWLLALGLTVLGIAANFYYSHQAWPIRLLCGLALVAVILAVIFQTFQGKKLISFARESRVELRKVVWPTRQETVNTTLVIGAVVVVIALLLWGMDGTLLWAIGWLTGQRG